MKSLQISIFANRIGPLWLGHHHIHNYSYRLIPSCQLKLSMNTENDKSSKSRLHLIHLRQVCISKVLNVPKSETSVDGKQQSSVSSKAANGDVTTSMNNNDRLSHIMQLYEDFVGLTEVKLAQDKVVKAEQQFLQVQEDRRAMQQELTSVQNDVRTISAELEKTHRTESKYLDLVKKEHEFLLVEKEMSNKIKTLDKAERDFFSFLSAAVRESHEKERARAEKTKYWSIIGSIIGAIIGIIGTTWNNHRRMKELRAIVTESGETTAEYKALTSKLIEDLLSQLARFQSVFASSLKGSQDLMENSDSRKDVESLFVNQKQFEENIERIISCVHSSSSDTSNLLKEIQELLKIDQARADNSNVVYVGPQIEDMLHQSEQKLSEKMKKNTIVATLVLGSCVSVGAAVTALIVKGWS